MRTRKRFLLIGSVATAVLFGAVLLWQAEREPLYRGKKLSQWIKLHSNPYNPTVYNLFPHQAEPVTNAEFDRLRSEAADAIHHIGTNALHTLLDWIDKDSPVPWKTKLASLLQKLPETLPGVRLLDWWLVARDHYRVDFGLQGFSLLGSTASPAVPELTRRMLTRNSTSGQFAISALGNIGPDSLPAMLAAVTNAAVPNRAWIIRCLVIPIKALGSNTGPAVAVIAKCTTDQTAMVALWSVNSLGDLAIEPAIAIPALTNALIDPRPLMRANSAQALSHFGLDARPAVPALLRYVNDPDQFTRESVTSALRKIAPETLRSDM